MVVTRGIYQLAIPKKTVTDEGWLSRSGAMPQMTDSARRSRSGPFYVGKNEKPRREEGALWNKAVVGASLAKHGFGKTYVWLLLV